MTIFQKMIFVPVLSLFIFSGFIVYSFLEQKRISTDIEDLRDDYMPVLVHVKDNIRDFDELTNALKDAVVAGERRWIADTLQVQQEIESRLTLLEAYPHIVNKDVLAQSKTAFLQYYENANAVANDIFNSGDVSQWDPDDAAVERTAKFQVSTSQSFRSMEQSVQSRFKKSLDTSYQGLNELLFWGGIISGASMLILLLATFGISLSTRKNIFQLISRTKALAQGEVNFSQRIKRTGRDELSELIYWFNRLSDKLEADYKQLQVVSITDKLTGLNNRTRTDQFLPGTLDIALTTQAPLQIVVVDIDHFKRINDRFGHNTGDKVLKQFADILRTSAKEHDFIGRWGGEEFILVWPDTDSGGGQQKAEAIRREVAGSTFPEVGQVTASFGMAQAQPGDTPENLINRADQALYQAKEGGRNRVVHYSSTNAQLEASL